MSETYKFMKCQNCPKEFFSLSQEMLHIAAETHMMKTGHTIVESNGDD